ncbi:MAG: flavin reductase family protein [Spirochaetaceae bacterium]|nr:flavin reductase family protein [Spirochaetaceae bacterium]
MNTLQKIDPKTIQENAIDLIGDKWMLVTAGTMQDHNTMTASWGGLGVLWGKPVAFVFIRPQRHTFNFTEKHEELTLSFFAEDYKKALSICGSVSGKDCDKDKEANLSPIQVGENAVSYKEARLILQCKKLYAEFLNEKNFVQEGLSEEFYKDKDFHRMYIVEITKAWIN